MSPRPQPRRAMRWADVYVGMLADGVALRNRCPQGQADPRAAIAGGASGVTMARAGAAGAAIRTKDSALGARYRRVMRHRGHKKAVVAVAHAMLRAVYHLLAEGTTYREPGADYYDRRHTHRVTRRAIQLLERQGYRVVLEPAA